METPLKAAELDQLCINTIRTLSMDAVQKANSGHPGTPMAIAQRWLAAHFNRPGHEIVDYRVFAICGDGDLMEGLSQEAASLAGHLALSNLLWIYDNNRITIEGNTALAFSDDVAERFMSYHWNVQRVGDANDLELLDNAIKNAIEAHSRPSLIILDSHIAWGAP